MLIVFRSA